MALQLQNLLLTKSHGRFLLLNSALQPLKFFLLVVHVSLGRFRFLSPLLYQVETAFQFFLRGLQFRLQSLVDFHLLLSFRFGSERFLLQILEIRVYLLVLCAKCLVLISALLDGPVLVLPGLAFFQEFLTADFKFPYLLVLVGNCEFLVSTLVFERLDFSFELWLKGVVFDEILVWANIEWLLLLEFNGNFVDFHFQLLVPLFPRFNFLFVLFLQLVILALSIGQFLVKLSRIRLQLTLWIGNFVLVLRKSVLVERQLVV